MVASMDCYWFSFEGPLINFATKPQDTHTLRCDDVNSFHFFWFLRLNMDTCIVQLELVFCC